MFVKTDPGYFAVIFKNNCVNFGYAIAELPSPMRVEVLVCRPSRRSKPIVVWPIFFFSRLPRVACVRSFMT